MAKQVSNEFMFDDVGPRGTSSDASREAFEVLFRGVAEKNLSADAQVDVEDVNSPE